jgi:amino acid adenylation domain-containing protein
MPALHEHVARHAAKRPDAEAVTDGAGRLSYRQLQGHAQAVARRLRAEGVRPGDAVLVCMKRSVWTIAALLGVLEAAAASVPLEPRTPAARRHEIIQGCRPAAVLCDAAQAEALAEDPELRALGASVLVVDGSHPAPPGELEPLPTVSSDALAYVLYTSGSTGRPKGVMLSHRNVDAYAGWAVERIGITARDRVLSTAPFYFDMSLFDIFCALQAGATLCVATERVLLFPKLLIRFAEAERVTVWKGVSSLLTYLSRTGALAPERMPTLRTVLFGGESLPPKYLRDWMLTFPDKVFYNFFGPTEGTGASLYHRVARAPGEDDASIPIGIPRENTPIYLLGTDGQPVAPGEVGELAIGGVCVAQGYLGDPERTARAFLDDPWQPGQRIYLTGDLARRLDDGTHLFVGRRDDQVKVMGYRLELGDIESALTTIPGVAEAGVLVAGPNRAGVDELVAYVVLTGRTDLALVRSALEARLPFYMLPRHIHPIDALPRSERGKLDRPGLQAHHRARGRLP